MLLVVILSFFSYYLFYCLNILKVKRILFICYLPRPRFGQKKNTLLVSKPGESPTKSVERKPEVRFVCVCVCVCVCACVHACTHMCVFWHGWGMVGCIDVCVCGNGCVCFDALRGGGGHRITFQKEHDIFFLQI